MEPVALVVDEKHLTFVSTNCAPPVVDQKHTHSQSIICSINYNKILS